MLFFQCLFCEIVDKNYGETLAAVQVAIDEFIEAKCEVEPGLHMYIIDFQLEFFKYIRNLNKPLAEMMNSLRPDIPGVIEAYLNSKKGSKGKFKVRGTHICGLRMRGGAA